MKLPSFTTQFDKDMKQSEKRGKDLTKIKAIMFDIICENPLPPKNNDHPLAGNYKGHRECHIQSRNFHDRKIAALCIYRDGRRKSWTTTKQEGTLGLRLYHPTDEDNDFHEYKTQIFYLEMKEAAKLFKEQWFATRPKVYS